MKFLVYQSVACNTSPRERIRERQWERKREARSRRRGADLNQNDYLPSWRRLNVQYMCTTAIHRGVNSAMRLFVRWLCNNRNCQCVKKFQLTRKVPRGSDMGSKKIVPWIILKILLLLCKQYISFFNIQFMSQITNASRSSWKHFLKWVWGICVCVWVWRTLQ